MGVIGSDAATETAHMASMTVEMSKRPVARAPRLTHARHHPSEHHVLARHEDGVSCSDIPRHGQPLGRYCRTLERHCWSC